MFSNPGRIYKQKPKTDSRNGRFETRRFRKRSHNDAPAKKKKRAAKTPPAEDTTMVQHNDYEDVRAQRIAQNAQLLGTLDLEGSVIPEPAKTTRKRCEPM